MQLEPAAEGTDRPAGRGDRAAAPTARRERRSRARGTVELKLSDGDPTAATVQAGAVTDDFTPEETNVGGYFREQVEGVTRGWVVSDTLELKGITSDESGGKTATTTSGFQSPPLSSSDQQRVGVKENPTAPVDSFAFLKARRRSRLKSSYDTA